MFTPRTLAVLAAILLAATTATAWPVHTYTETYELAAGDFHALRDANSDTDIGGVIWDGCLSSYTARPIHCYDPDAWDIVIVTVNDAVVGQNVPAYLCFDLDGVEVVPGVPTYTCDIGRSFCGTTAVSVKVEKTYAVIVYVDSVPRVDPATGEVCGPGTTGDVTMTIDYDFCWPPCIPTSPPQPSETQPRTYTIVS